MWWPSCGVACQHLWGVGVVCRYEAFARKKEEKPAKVSLNFLKMRGTHGVARITLSRDVSEARATCFRHSGRAPPLACVDAQGPVERTPSPGPVVCPVGVTAGARGPGGPD